VLISILGFLVVLGPLVIVHEFGHFTFAKIFGVRADIFSIGFGPRMWSKQIGETEFRVSWIPLGGYVKLFGEDSASKGSPAEQKRALHKQEAWKRFFIFFGGPLFNFIFAVLIFMAILVIGEPQMASYVGRSVQGSAAQRAGFQSGDQVVSINGTPVRKFEEVLTHINEHPDLPMTFLVKHPGQTTPKEIRITPTIQSGYSVYGEAVNVGEIEGLLPTSRSMTIGVSNPNSPAGRAGIKTGDIALTLNGAEINDWETLENAYRNLAPSTTFQLQVKTGKATRNVLLNKPAKATNLGEDLGLYSSELFIDKTVKAAPAETAGVRAGDRIVTIHGHKVQSFFELRDSVQRAGEKDGKVNVSWERNGKIMTAAISPTSTTGRDPSLRKTTQYTIGIVPMLTWAEPKMILERTWNPFVLVYKATERMAVYSWRNLVSIKKMFTGDVSVGTLGGPILIAKISGESLSRGLIAFLTTMAILSVGLGILNVLPVPVLDGGHLLLLGIESIRGRPLTLRQMEIFQQVGLSLILLLMIVVMRNDLARLPIFQ
jgi:regulator of sigma E protease